ncbi:MAG: hypothetical protein JW940_09580 [Polyangiaceae bacterium]|nr:hypothetical protein [Polyangiaceae bacterium]
MKRCRLLLFLLALATVGALSGALTHTAQATVARALSLTELVGKSDAVIVGTPTRWSSQWVSIGGHRRMVTDTRIKVTRRVFGVDTHVTEITVRTLGGRIGDLGQLVHGEASFGRGQSALVFLRRLDGSRYRVTGMAQGHFSVGPDAQGIIRLGRGLNGTHLLGGSFSPVSLVGADLEQAIATILEIRAHG